MTNNEIYTHDEAARILEVFEECLEYYNIHVPSPEDDERDPDNMVGLYGSTYSVLLDMVESRLISLLKQADGKAVIIPWKFSGNY